MRIFKDVGARRALGVHWGTFQLTDEARDDPIEALAVALEEEEIAPSASPLPSRAGDQGDA